MIHESVYRDKYTGLSVGGDYINSHTAGAIRGGGGFGNYDRRYWGCWWIVNGMPCEAGELRGCRAVLDDFGNLRRVQ